MKLHAKRPPVCPCVRRGVPLFTCTACRGTGLK